MIGEPKDKNIVKKSAGNFFGNYQLFLKNKNFS